jgi:hypothetical protein
VIIQAREQKKQTAPQRTCTMPAKYNLEYYYNANKFTQHRL